MEPGIAFPRASGEACEGSARTCTYCVRPFTTKKQLQRHIRYHHTTEKKHKCIECNYTTVEKPKLRIHQRSHTGERPYKCPHCTYAATTLSNLKRHIPLHESDPYKCDLCNTYFKILDKFNDHMRIHYDCDNSASTAGPSTTPSTQENVCTHPECKQSFADEIQLVQHMETHYQVLLDFADTEDPQWPLQNVDPMLGGKP